MTDLQPDLDEVLQAEEHGPNEEIPVAVVVEGVVRTQTLPQKSGSTKTVPIAAAGARPVKVLSADHRRARTQLMAIGGAFRFAFNVGSKEDPSTMALWPANTAMTHLGDDEIWVIAETVAITLSVVTGRWAVGDDGGS